MSQPVGLPQPHTCAAANPVTVARGGHILTMGPGGDLAEAWART
jgi:hypothetical protein